MSTTQPEALRLADLLVRESFSHPGYQGAADELRRQHAEIARLTAALDDAQAEGSMAQMEAERARLPSSPQEVMDFIGSNFHSVGYANGVDELGRPLGAASEHDSYCVSAHDLLWAFSNWFWADLPAAERQPLTDEQIKQIAHHEFLMGEGIWDENTAEDLTNFARAVELAHGVGSKP